MGAVPFKISKRQTILFAIMTVGFVFFAGDAMAGGTTKNIGGIASLITTSFTAVTKLITATAYLAGMGFSVGSIIKFKAHKDNPAQVPIGQPVGLLIVAAALLFLPTILGVTGTTIFGTTAKTQGPRGTIFSTN